MKTTFAVVLGLNLLCAANLAFAECNVGKTECEADNRCFGPGGISCSQFQQCRMINGQATWVPLQGSGFSCNGSFKITIIEATAKAQMFDKTVNVTSQVAGVCNDKEVCSFTPKGSGALLGDLTPGSHYGMFVKFVCRSSTASKGITRIEFGPELDEKPINFNCIE